MNDEELKQAVERLPKQIEPPRDLWPGIEARIGARRGRLRWRQWYWAPLAAAAALVAVLIGRSIPTSWDVAPLAGRPLLGAKPLAGSGRLRVGDWIETDDSSRALIAVGRIGQVEVKPASRIQLVDARPDDHRLALAHGTIDAKVEAVPRLFFVETPAGTAIDLGCAYTLTTDSLGNGRLHVTAGEVEFEGTRGGGKSRSSRVPFAVAMQTRSGAGPGIPFVEDAPAPYVRALTLFDFGGGGARAARTIIALSRPQDALSLWHLLQRVDSSLRGAVYDRLAALVAPPRGITRKAAVALDSTALESYWKVIHRIHFRRVILQGVRRIDPRTGLAPR
jgi:hypothetical protein